MVQSNHMYSKRFNLFETNILIGTIVDLPVSKVEERQLRTHDKTTIEGLEAMVEETRQELRTSQQKIDATQGKLEAAMLQLSAANPSSTGSNVATAVGAARWHQPR